MGSIEADETTRLLDDDRLDRRHQSCSSIGSTVGSEDLEELQKSVIACYEQKLSQEGFYSEGHSLSKTLLFNGFVSIDGVLL